MRLVVADPGKAVITFEDADAHLRLDGDTSDQDLIESYIEAAIATLDGADGWLGRNMSQRTVDAYAPCFGWEMHLPLGPVGSVTAVQYRDPVTGAWQTVDPSVYELRGDVLGTRWRQRWPICADHPESVHLSYQAGYQALPKPIRSAILLMLGDLYANRETVETGIRAAAVAVPMSTTVEALLNPYRLYG